MERVRRVTELQHPSSGRRPLALRVSPHDVVVDECAWRRGSYDTPHGLGELFVLFEKLEGFLDGRVVVPRLPCAAVVLTIVVSTIFEENTLVLANLMS